MIDNDDDDNRANKKNQQTNVKNFLEISLPSQV